MLEIMNEITKEMNFKSKTTNDRFSIVIYLTFKRGDYFI